MLNKEILRGPEVMATMTRKEYAQMYGPTTGDAIRLGDTSLIAEVEHDFAIPVTNACMEEEKRFGMVWDLHLDMTAQWGR